MSVIVTLSAAAAGTPLRIDANGRPIDPGSAAAPQEPVHRAVLAQLSRPRPRRPRAACVPVTHRRHRWIIL